MLSFLIQRMCFAVLFLMLLPCGIKGQTAIGRERIDDAYVKDVRDHPDHSWTLVPSFGWSFFNKGRDSWQYEGIELYHYLAEEKLLLDASVEMMQRPPNGSDVVYGFGASWYPNDHLELHGRIQLTDDADFMPSERYGLGMQYRFHPQWELLMDVEHLNFGSYAQNWDDGITQIKPGLTYWFNDKTRITMRYTHGWVHDEVDYDYYSLDLTLGDLPRNAELVLSLAYGTDPDIGFGTGKATLTDAYVIGLMYKQPINPDLTFFVGLEYVYRLRPDNDRELYQMLTPTIGLSWKF